MKRLALSLLTAGLVLGTATLAIAGQRGPFGFGPFTSYTNGAFGDVRNSADPNSAAMCGSNDGVGFCAFYDQSGRYYSCYTTSPGQIDVIRSMNGDSFFSVAWDASGHCTYVLSYTDSRAQPKAL